MSSLMKSVSDQLTQGDTLKRLGDVLGTNDDETNRAVRAAIPAVLGGLANRIRQPDGDQAVSNMLDQADRSPTSRADYFVNGHRDAGASMLDDIFGRDRSNLESGLAQQSGLGAGVISKALPMLAPVVMDALARRRTEGSLDNGGVEAVLGKEKVSLQHQGLLGGLTASQSKGGTHKSGDVIDEWRERSRLDGPGGSGSGSGGGGRWRWLLALGVLLVAAFVIFSQCSGGEVTDAIDDATGAAGDAVEDAADGAADAAGDAVDAMTGDPDIQVAADGALATSPDFSDVTAVVADGAVTLTGTVADADAAAAAVSSVAALDGVTSVDNQLTLTEETSSGDGTSEDAAPAPVITLNDTLDLDPITFAVNSAELTDEGQAVVDRALEYLTTNPDVDIAIGGHTDSDGDDSSNLALSKQRAETVRAYLESNGIEGTRMTATGYGETAPKVDNDTDENKAINRRIEFIVL